MQNKFIRFTGVSLVVIALIGTASSVEARTLHTAHKRVTVVHTDSKDAKIAALQSEVDTFKVQMAAMTARLDAQDAAQHATADQVAAASADAQAAAEQSSALSGQLSKSVVTQVKSAISANAPKLSWTADTKISGLMFFDTSNINQKNYTLAGVGSKTVPSGTGFDVKRLYIGVDHKFNDIFSATAIIDANANGAYSGNANLNGANVYLKNAYLQAILNDMLIVRLGAAPMPWIPYTEAANGQRYIENMFVDRVKLGNTTDWGIHALGTLGDAKGFNITYAASAVNGGGYKNPTRSNSVDLEGRVAANYKGFSAAVGGYTGKLAADAQNVALYGGLTAPRTASRFDAFVGYSGPRFRIGGEYLWAKDFSQNMVLGGSFTPFSISGTTGLVTGGTIKLVPEDVAEGFSGYGTFYVTPKFSLFGRYDSIKPNKYTAPLRKEDFFNLGVTYSPVKIVDLSLVYKRDVLNNNGGVTGSFSTQDASLGGTGVNRTTYDELGLFGQWKF